MPYVDSTAHTTAGILMPKLSYRFRVRFLDGTLQPLPYGDNLTAQVMSISEFEFSDVSIFPGNITIIFEDDVANTVSKALKQFQSKDNTNTYFMALDLMSSDDKILEQYMFRNVYIKDMMFPELSYEGGPSSFSTPIAVESDAPEYDLDIHKLPEMVQMLYHILRKIRITIPTPPKKSSHTIKRTVRFGYDGIRHNII